jgi:hypothetical protein
VSPGALGGTMEVCLVVEEPESVDSSLEKLGL